MEMAAERGNANSHEPSGSRSVFSFQGFSQFLFANDESSEMAWLIVYCTFGLAALVFGMGVVGPLFWGWGFWWTLVYLAIGFGLAGTGQRLVEMGRDTIPAKPPYVAFVSIWGFRFPIIRVEGEVMRLNFWPFYLKYVLVLILQRNFDFQFQEVPCKATDADGNVIKGLGAFVTVKASITLVPDWRRAFRLIKYMNNDEMEGVIKIITDMLNESIRHLSVLYDWETFAEMKAQLTVLLMAKIADVEFRKLPRNDDGSFPKELHRIKSDDYHDIGEAVDPLEYLFEQKPQDVSAERWEREQRCRLKEIEIFLRVARENDVTDILDLGVKVARLNVNSIVPEGETKTETDRAAAEKKQREREKSDADTLNQLIDDYIYNAATWGQTVPYERAAEHVRAIKGIAKEVIVRSPNSLEGAAALLSQNQG